MVELVVLDEVDVTVRTTALVKGSTMQEHAPCNTAGPKTFNASHCCCSDGPTLLSCRGSGESWEPLESSESRFTSARTICVTVDVTVVVPGGYCEEQ